MHHPTDRITHTTAFVTPVVEHWLEQEIAQWVHHEGSIRRPIHHERTLLPRSYISLPYKQKHKHTDRHTQKHIQTHTALTDTLKHITHNRHIHVLFMCSVFVFLSVFLCAYTCPCTYACLFIHNCMFYNNQFN